MQELERRIPFIAYVDPLKPFALSQAAELSQLWQVPVIGLTIPELAKRRAQRNTAAKSHNKPPDMRSRPILASWQNDRGNSR